MPDLPPGTVMPLFTDIEGSTHFWKQYPAVTEGSLASQLPLSVGRSKHEGGVVLGMNRSENSLTYAARPFSSSLTE
jgi:hypothetical protein